MVRTDRTPPGPANRDPYSGARPDAHPGGPPHDDRFGRTALWRTSRSLPAPCASFARYPQAARFAPPVPAQHPSHQLGTPHSRQIRFVAHRSISPQHVMSPLTSCTEKAELYILCHELRPVCDILSGIFFRYLNLCSAQRE